MMLGSDVSGLSTTAAAAAAQGLSIVVPVYNEAAGLAALHERLIGLAKTLKARYGLAAKWSMSTTAAPMPRWRSRAGSKPTRSTSRWCRCRAISARKPP